MRSRVGILAGVVAAALAVPAMAAPLIQMSIVGRVVGDVGAYSSSVTAAPGQQVEYQVLFQMAPLTTQNIQGAVTRTINSLTLSQATTGDGVNNLKFDIVNRAASQSTTAFGASALNADPSSLTSDSWAGGTGPSAGAPTGADLLGVRPIHGTGLQTFGNPEMILSGVFTVGGAGGPGFLDMRWAAGGTGAAKINGGATLVAITATSEAGADPFVGYQSLAINVPEPGTIGLLGLGLVGGLVRRRRA